ncbi:hypothetical protein ILUMI_18807, partial [Ignelater luminosus]
SCDSFINRLVDNENEVGQIVHGEWRKKPNALANISNQGSHNYSREIMQLRNDLCDYVCSEAGRVPWQDNILMN